MMLNLLKKTAIGFFLLLAYVAPASAEISAQQVAIIVNMNDSDSRQIAAYYQKKRGIPKDNLIEVRIPVGKDSLSEKDFQQAYQQVKKKDAGYSTILCFSVDATL